MSLILEALKKSERQRRLGKAPTLATPVSTLRRRRPLPLLILLLALLALVTGAAWWLLRGKSPALPWLASPASVVQTESAVTADSDDEPDAAAEIESPIVTHQPLPAATPQNQPEAAVQTQAQREPAQAAPAAAAAAETPQESPATPAPQAPVAPPAAAVQLIWELPYSLRRDLPELNLTMHVYADHPAGRMAIINGERLGEGEELVEGLTLREIRTDGLLLEFRGQTFLYPRGGR